MTEMISVLYGIIGRSFKRRFAQVYSEYARMKRRIVIAIGIIVGLLALLALYGAVEEDAYIRHPYMHEPGDAVEAAQQPTTEGHS